MPPAFYIIMGPNGAGKSTFGSLYTNGTRVYDPDKRRIEISSYLLKMSQTEREQLFPAYSSDMFHDMSDELIVNYQWEEYEELRQHCVGNLSDFALETPFADNFGINQVYLFKAQKYNIHGIFFGLNSVEQSIANVSIRVQKKGHDLPLQSIAWNFEQCYINLNKHYTLFDSIIFMDAQSPLINPVLVAQYIEKRLIPVQPNMPEWFKLIPFK